KIAEKAFDRVNAYRRIELAAVTTSLAGMITNAAMNRRHRIVVDQDFPRFAIFSGLSKREPSLDIFTGWAAVVARRQEIDIDRLLRSHGTGPSMMMGQVHHWRHIARLGTHIH